MLGLIIFILMTWNNLINIIQIVIDFVCGNIFVTYHDFPDITNILTISITGVFSYLLLQANRQSNKLSQRSLELQKYIIYKDQNMQEIKEIEGLIGTFQELNKNASHCVVDKLMEIPIPNNQLHRPKVEEYKVLIRAIKINKLQILEVHRVKPEFITLCNDYNDNCTAFIDYVNPMDHISPDTKHNILNEFNKLNESLIDIILQLGKHKKYIKCESLFTDSNN